MILLLLLPFTESLLCFREYMNIILCSSSRKTGSGMCSHAASRLQSRRRTRFLRHQGPQTCCSRVVEPALWVRITLVSGLDLKMRQHIPVHFLPSQQEQYISVSQLRTWALWAEPEPTAGGDAKLVVEWCCTGLSS